MNEKYYFDKRIEYSEINKERNLKRNERKLLNFLISPRNKTTKSFNKGNASPRSPSNYMSKKNFSYKSILDNINKIKKQSSTNNQNNLNNKNYKKDNHGNSNSYKQLIDYTNLELKDKDINNFKEFKRIQDLNNKLLFQKGIVNKNIESILFQNNNTYNNILFKQKQNKHNNIDTNTEVNKNDITSIMILKNKPLIVKLDPKRSSSCLNGYTSKNVDLDDMKTIKTPPKMILIENDKKKSIGSLCNTTRSKNTIKSKKQFAPEENHFRAVIYEQEIKKYNMAVD
jgi:hypothetical protein